MNCNIIERVVKLLRQYMMVKEVKQERVVKLLRQYMMVKEVKQERLSELHGFHCSSLPCRDNI